MRSFQYASNLSRFSVSPSGTAVVRSSAVFDAFDECWIADGINRTATSATKAPTIAGRDLLLGTFYSPRFGRETRRSVGPHRTTLGRPRRASPSGGVLGPSTDCLTAR